MSGIFAVLRRDDEDSGPSLSHLAAALADHGPDGGSTWIGPGPERSAGLGHLLMRLTPEDAFEAQPVSSASGDLVLVADARLDNRDELSESLGVSPPESRTWPDSAFVLRAFERWGEDSPRHLLGDFTFCVLDRRSRRLFAARDRSGSRVLFYFSSDRLLAFASSVEALLALPEVACRLNEARIADFLLLTGDPEETFYQGIRRLPPGHSLRASADGLEVSPYWTPDPSRRLRLGSDGEYVEAFLEAFEAAVRRRLRSAHPVGSFLSGGLDTSAVTCLAARQMASSGRRLSAYVLLPRAGFDAPEPPGWYHDEAPYAELVRQRHPNLDVHHVRAEGRTPLDGLDRLFRTAGGPFRDVNRIWGEAALETARSRGERVMLGGLEGNWTVSYSGGALLPELARDLRLPSLLRELSSLAKAHGVSRRTAFVEALVKPLLPEALWWSRQLRGEPPLWARRSLLAPGFAAELRVSDRMRRFDVAPTFLWGSEGGSRRARWVASGARQELLDVQAARRAAFGVDVREVTMDSRLLELCLSIPSEQYLRKGQGRSLIRRALAGVVPDEVLWKKKRGTEAPDWYERLGPMREELRREVDGWERSDGVRRCLDLARLRQMLDAWPRTVEQWNRPDTVGAYRFLFIRAIIAGRFIRWYESGSPR